MLKKKPRLFIPAWFQSLRVVFGRLACCKCAWPGGRTVRECCGNILIFGSISRFTNSMNNGSLLVEFEQETAYLRRRRDSHVVCWSAKFEKW